MKKSKMITLVLVTGSALIACQQRNQYASWDDCAKDYGDRSKCTEEREQTTGGIYRTYYYGPSYRGSRSADPAYNPSVRTSRSVGVVRGGWGFHGSSGSHSSGAHGG
jgi:hypothetical protein